MRKGGRGRKKGGHVSSVPPAAIQSAGFSSRRRACMEKNVKSGTSFPPIWTFIDCGRDRERRGGEGEGEDLSGRARPEIPSISKMILEPSRALTLLPFHSLDRAYVIVVREEAGPRAIEKIKIQPRDEISVFLDTGQPVLCSDNVRA